MCNLEIFYRTKELFFHFSVKRMPTYAPFIHTSSDFVLFIHTLVTPQIKRALFIFLKDLAFLGYLIFLTFGWLRAGGGSSLRALLWDVCRLTTTPAELASSARKSFWRFCSFDKSSRGGEQISQQGARECFCREGWSGMWSSPRGHRLRRCHTATKCSSTCLFLILVWFFICFVSQCYLAVRSFIGRIT